MASKIPFSCGHRADFSCAHPRPCSAWQKTRNLLFYTTIKQICHPPPVTGLTGLVQKSNHSKKLRKVIYYFTPLLKQICRPASVKCHTVLVQKSNHSDRVRKVEAVGPISLCNVYYKQFVKIVANHLQNVTEPLLGDHQTSAGNLFKLTFTLQGLSLRTIRVL